MDTRARLTLPILILGLINLAPRAVAADPGAGRGHAPSDSVRVIEISDGAPHLLSLINRERAAAGRPPMALRDDLVSLAAGFNRRIAAEGGLRHNNDFLSVASASRLGASQLGENVAMEPDLETAHARLMDSPAHRANILEPAFRFVGIAVVRGGNGAVYVTQDFLAPAGPRTAAKAPSPVPKPAARQPRARVSRARPPAPRPVLTTTTTAPAPPAAGTPAAAAPPTASEGPTVLDVLGPVPPLEAVGGGGQAPLPGQGGLLPASGGGRHDPASFQLLMMGSALALRIRRVR